MAKNQRINPKRLVVIGGSAGSIEVIISILHLLKPFTTFSIVIIIHRKDFVQSNLAELFSFHTSLKISEIEDKWPLLKGEIYLAPANYHILIEKNLDLVVDSSEKVNHSRPSIDVTFQSAAEIFNDKTIGILLSGANNDGTIGLQKIKQLGGFSIAQNPIQATYPFMPRNVIKLKAVNAIYTIEEIAQYLNQLDTLK